MWGWPTNIMIIGWLLVALAIGLFVNGFVLPVAPS